MPRFVLLTPVTRNDDAKCEPPLGETDVDDLRAARARECSRAEQDIASGYAPARWSRQLFNTSPLQNRLCTDAVNTHPHLGPTEIAGRTGVHHLGVKFDD